MAYRGELSSIRVKAESDNSTYFFNFKENRHGDLFLNFVISIKKENIVHRPFQRHGIVVFEEQLETFFATMRKALIALQAGRPFQYEFETLRGRKYTILIKSKKYGCELLVREENQESTSFEKDSVHIPQHLSRALEDGLKKSYQEWKVLKEKMNQEKTIGIPRVKVRRIVRSPPKSL